MEEGSRGEIIVVTGNGEGHLQPCINLCNHLVKRKFHTTIVLSSALTSSIPSSFAQNPLASIASMAPSRPLDKHPAAEDDLHRHLQLQLASTKPPLCAIIDFQMGWTKNVFWKFDIPVISLFTFGGCAAAMEWAAWKLHAADLNSSSQSTLLIPGLPNHMSFTYSELQRKPSTRGPKPGHRPPWVPEIEGSMALIFNSCRELDGPFIDYMQDQMGLSAWGVGPLLPDSYWQPPSDSLVGGIYKRRESSITEDEVIQWLDSKPDGSVLYVAFGSEVGPTVDENRQLAMGLLQRTSRPFIWVIQKKQEDYSPEEEAVQKAGDRCLIIQGWAPQLAILGHPSTGGFLSHCGWNSTMEAIGLGVPILAWPIRGDQFYNAKLVVSHLRLGYKVADDLSQMVQMDDIVRGIDRLMEDEEMHERAIEFKAKLKDNGFPPTAEAALDAFTEFILNLKNTATGPG